MKPVPSTLRGSWLAPTTPDLMLAVLAFSEMGGLELVLPCGSMTLCLRSVSLVLDPGVWCVAAVPSLVVELLLVLGSLYMTSSSCLCPGDLLDRSAADLRRFVDDTYKIFFSFSILGFVRYRSLLGNCVVSCVVK